MSSTVFYRFKSQKTTSRITFDGTGITVFDLKREIIQENRLGDGTDFQLRLYNPDTNEEYEDDAFVVPRSTSVLARRSPSNKIAKNNATRYVTGKPRVVKSTGASLVVPVATIEDDKLTEEERIAKMFANQDDAWSRTQQQMAGATPVFKSKAQAAADELPPPPGYICYRCGAKDHWIKNCPTNNDPNWEGRRIKRTTGIPKKYLQTITDPKLKEEMRNNKNVMVNEDGSIVVQVADTKAWESYQKRVAKRPAQYDDVPSELVDSITKEIFQNPVKTPCCAKTYSKRAIEDALVDSDFVCPECGKEDVLLDSLVADSEMEKRVQEWVAEYKKKKTEA